MEKLFGRFPEFAAVLVLALLGLVAYQYKMDSARTTASIDNNTKAMKELTCTIQEVNKRTYRNESRLDVHDSKLENHDHRLEKGGL